MTHQSKLQNEQTDSLFEAILLLEGKEECYRFFDDLCTVKEVQAMSQRLEVAKMLKDKKTYVEIEDKTGASTATISRINRALNYGEGGYKLILERLESAKED